MTWCSFLKPFPQSLHGSPTRGPTDSDEVVPGNQLSGHNLRKCWVVYMSFAQLGPLLTDEDAWICLACVRTDAVKNFGGGIAQVFSALLKFMCSAENSHSFQHSGIRLVFGDGSPFRFYASLQQILQDGGAHKQVFMVKGEAGHKYCILCRNLYSEASGVCDEHGDSVLTCSHVFGSELDFATDDDVRGTVKRLADFAKTKTKAEVEVREMACDFNHNWFNLLLEPRLVGVVHPVSCFAHDFMHTFCVHGVWNTITYLWLSALIESGARNTTSLIAEFLLGWTHPLRMGGPPKTVQTYLAKFGGKRPRKPSTSSARHRSASR